ncbi:amino acid adenylation domain-containing protein [Rhodobacteraceae bacterium M382]|nr:amino acid adenylation domain-containing protein [Rhodobacteraceae bacterium M382]
MTTNGQASFGQIAIWGDVQVLTDAPVHNLVWEVEIQAHISAAAMAEKLSKALSRVVRRQQGLQSVFAAIPGGVSSIRSGTETVRIEVVDATAQSRECDRKRDLEFGMAAFDLGAGPLYRFRLEHRRDATFRLVCAFHHMIIDGLTWTVFLEDLRDALTQTPSEPLSVSYQDFCEAQQKDAQSEAFAPSIAYWQEKTASPGATWDLPGDRSANSAHSAAGGVLQAAVPRRVCQLLVKRSAELGLSPFRLAFAAFSEWASRISRQQDVMIATTLGPLPTSGFKGVIGLFGTVHHIESVRTSETTFCDLAYGVSRQIKLSQRHQAVALRTAFEAANGSMNRRSAYVAPPAAFTRLPSRRTFETQDMIFGEKRVFLPVANRDLGVYFQDVGESFELTWVYREARFDRFWIERAARQFEHILEQGLSDPDQKLSALATTPPAERAEILRHAIGEPADAPTDTPLHRLIERQAQKTPKATAVVCEAERLTYSEVDTKANYIAHRLTASGVKRGDLVPMVMASSPEMLLTELAVLKIGGVFVPLDSGWPKSRVLAVVNQIQANVIVTRIQDRAALAYLDVPTVELPAPSEILQLDQCSDGVDIGADDPVYCLFTSGSTGRPKGAINTNQGVVNRIQFMLDRFCSGFDPKVLATSGTTADTLVWQYFFPLCCGGTCVIAQPEVLISPDQTAEICRKEQVTLLDYVPSVFNEIANRADNDPGFGDALASVRTILIGGEAMQPEPVNRFRARFPGVSVYNSYGPTEAAISAVVHRIDENITAPVPIGRPIPNVTAVVLDDFGDIAPFDHIGELYLGGVCAGLGYLGDPWKTAHSFVQLPKVGPGRFYRTGDTAWMRGDGLLMTTGRFDNQIALNGTRIEPGEIEAALMTHPDIVEAVAVLQNNPERPHPYLAVLVVAEPDVTVTATQLRDFLADRVPRNMLPGAYYSVGALPRGASGKIDRSAATNCPDAVQLHIRCTNQRPLNELETTIVDIWKTVLAFDSIGGEDNFFLDLAGDSLTALKCHMLLEEALNRKLSLQDFFRHATPISLAQAVSNLQTPAETPPELPRFQAIQSKLQPFLKTWQGEQSRADSLLYTLNAAGRGKHLFWCFQGFNELKQLADHLGPEHPVTGMRSGHLVFDYAQPDVQALSAHYAYEIDALKPEGCLTIGGNCQATVIVREVVRQLRAKGRVVDLTIFMEDTDFSRHLGSAALLYGRDSHLNPFSHGADPSAWFNNLYPDGFTSHTIPGGHAQFFTDQNIVGLSSVIRGLLKREVSAADP